MMEKEYSRGTRLHELDSFYGSRIGIFINNIALSSDVHKILSEQGFNFVTVFTSYPEFVSIVHDGRFDLVIINVDITAGDINGFDMVQNLRENDADVAIITISDEVGDARLRLECSIDRHFLNPVRVDDLLKGAKMAIGDKTSYEIGMQFFDALFGMQMCTHRDLHQRTFDHVIRTTKVYGKFLLYLIGKGYLELTSWTLKNCLMASLVHDIGKLLVMHGVLYKDGRLTAFEYEQVKRHPWNSITALLGGHDIDFFARDGKPLETVSGYNEKNLSVQVQKWIFKVFDGDVSSLLDEENFFNELSHKPFIHSLNMDFLYIVFRHHDAVNKPYLTSEELARFGQILGKEVSETLSPDSTLDLVTNALSLCDVFDALLDTKRDYRKIPYSKFFSLILLYNEMKNGKFFPDLTEEFIRFVLSHELSCEENPFVKLDTRSAIEAIKSVSETFLIKKEEEGDFSEFFGLKKDEFAECFYNKKPLTSFNLEWRRFYEDRCRQKILNFAEELKRINLLDRNIELFSTDERKVFDMLCLFYYSYSSSYKQKKLMDYLVYSVLKNQLSDSARARIEDILRNSPGIQKKDFEKLLIEKGYDRDTIFNVFKNYDEDTMINELNDFLKTQGI
jgi:hypothetical protein